MSAEDFVQFYDHVATYAKIAREALDAASLKDQVDKWQQLFGDKFPDAPEDDSEDKRNGSSGGFTQRKEPSIIGGGRFA